MQGRENYTLNKNENADPFIGLHLEQKGQSGISWLKNCFHPHDLKMAFQKSRA